MRLSVGRLGETASFVAKAMKEVTRQRKVLATRMCRGNSMQLFIPCSPHFHRSQDAGASKESISPARNPALAKAMTERRI